MLVIFFAGIETGWGQTIFKTPLSPRNASYDIRVILNPAQKKVSGSEVLHWKNISGESARELQFHLYMNAFRNKHSTFMQESRRIPESLKEYPGRIDIRSMVLNGTIDLTPNIEFIQPDDDNRRDSTVIRVALPQEIPPGGEISLKIDFATVFPKIIARTGFLGDFYLFGQWFPKIGVFEDGNWDCHQFHANSEFFADFGVYDVWLTLPDNFVVGATGIEAGTEATDSAKTVHFHAEDVHDFALTAYPAFKSEERDVEGISVRLLYPPEHAGNVNRYFEAISYAIHDFGEWYMPYPYPCLTIVDPPLSGLSAGGMEYPMFITGGSIWGLPRSILLGPEEVTVHEFGHQFFYGILASNEFEEAWLDEGFTTYITARVMNRHYGEHTSWSSFLNLDVGDVDELRTGYIRHPATDFIVKPVWEFELGGASRMVYTKAMLTLLTLENYLGEDLMGRIMKTYVARWKFRHPHTADFTAIVNEIAPQNMDWYLDAALYHTDVLDYALQGISNKTKEFRDEKSDSMRTLFESEVRVQRMGTFIMPVEIQVVFTNGDTLSENWDGKAPYKVYQFRKTDRVISACVDPQNKVYLDVNWTNNSYRVDSTPLAGRRFWLKTLEYYQNYLFALFSF